MFGVNHSSEKEPSLSSSIGRRECDLTSFMLFPLLCGTAFIRWAAFYV